MRHAQLIDAVQQRTGLRTADEADRVLRIVARVVGEHMLPADARAVAARLPEPVAQALLSWAQGEPLYTVQDFYQRMAAELDLPLGFAMEQAQAACQALTEAVAPIDRNRFPHPLAPLFEPRPEPHPVAPLHVARKLARTRPGSRHPLSSGRPAAGQLHSVAANPDPHSDTRLSSARGFTAERRRKTLASGRPGSRTSLAEDHDE